ncbi:hypothetical protein Bca52824_020892 [Brassica carinata]|uniref:Uncharacterized protein n=1 Tax=Brassica carinata TaxID=52824 RepID=A0A8X8B011_BRACI|nr:hypothetical protein Bca52824_020892 [Brassica carinata]
MVDVATKKIPGCSLIEVNGIAHEFVCGDKSHLQSEEIHMKLEELAQESTFAGYLPSELLFEAGAVDKRQHMVQLIPSLERWIMYVKAYRGDS